MPGKTWTPRYAVNRYHPLSHVATELERARLADTPVPWEEVVRSYTYYPVLVDLGRVCKWEGLGSDAEAMAFLLDWARAYLDGDIIERDGGLLLARPLAELRGLDNRPIVPSNNTVSTLGDLYSPLTAAKFAENSRWRRVRKDSPSWVELRDSMQTDGWRDILPAIKDERGVIIDGHRRLEVAAELGIEPKIVERRYGSDDHGELERLRDARAANRGREDLTKADRAYQAKVLYDRGWTQQQIAEEMKVAVGTVNADLRVFNVENSHPERGGRPRKEKLTPDQNKWAAEQRLDAGRTIDAVAADLAVDWHVVKRAVVAEEARRETLASLAPAAYPPPGAAPALPSQGGPAAEPARTPCPHCEGRGYL